MVIVIGPTHHFITDTIWRRLTLTFSRYKQFRWYVGVLPLSRSQNGVLFLKSVRMFSGGKY